MPGQKILFIKATASPVGGVATWLDYANQLLSEIGYDVISGLVKGTNSHCPDQYSQKHPGLEAVVIDGSSLNYEGRVNACFKTIQRVKPDFVVPLGVVETVDAAAIAKQRLDLRLIGRTQGNLPPMLADIIDDRECTDHVICDGALTEEFLLNHAAYEPARVSRIPNGAGSIKVARPVGPVKEPVRIGYVGRLSESDKRAHDLIPMCKQLVDRGIDFHLTICGTGPLDRRLRSELGYLGDAVVFKGAVNAAELFEQVYPLLDILTLFSSTETFGIVLVEAMMHGIVPVTSRYSGFHSERLIVDHCNGLSFPIGDAHAAVKRIEYVVANPKSYLKMSSNAREKAAQYTWENCFQQWSECLQNSLNCERTRATKEPGTSNSSGRLDRLGIPRSIVNQLRNFRRKIQPQFLPKGGEEWNLFRGHHSQGRLNEIATQCLQIEEAASRGAA